jgi:hypothetical protein
MGSAAAYVPGNGSTQSTLHRDLCFIAALVKSLACPGTLLILLWYFRAPIRKALHNLTRLKYGDLEMDFGHKLEEVKKEAEAIDILPEPQPTEKIAPTQKNSLQLLDEAAQLAERFPEPAIAVAWEAVEAQVLDSVLRLKIRPEDANLRHPLGHAPIFW